ncbi:MAG: sulfurtransferase [Gammaproteobacteria bacterium]|nr:MAG: sulfurtransferase [Gammaproteobacteria bacterium]
MRNSGRAVARILVVLGFGFLATTAWAAGYARPELLIETEELAKIVNQPNVRLVDAVDPAGYQRAHIPGAVNVFYVDLAKLDERKKSGHPLSNADAERIFGEAGIDNNTQVVVYDGGEGPSASGVWFVLDFFGHKNVKVLNGGFRKWLKEGRPVTQDVPVVEKKRFLAKEHPAKVITRASVEKSLRAKDAVIVDTRSFNEYIGKDVRPGASRGGHIPGAVHLEWTKFSDKVNTFKTAEQLEKALKQRGIDKNTKVVTYCQTGIGRSTDMALAMRLIGYDNVVEYTGSWEEWSADPRLPIEK